MSPARPTGPRPQRVEVEDVIDGALETTAAALGALTGIGLDKIREQLRGYTLQLLEAIGVDSGGVTMTSNTTPVVQRKRRRKES